MCGLVGILDHNDTKSLGMKVLKELEYRGYDSFGYFLQNSNLSTYHHRSCDKISDDIDNNDYSQYRNGLFHTRWSTSGKVNIENAHPIFSPQKTFCVVHNGIYHSHKHEGKSDTHNFAKNFEVALRATNCKLTYSNSHHILRVLTSVVAGSGDNVFLIMFPDIPNTLFCACSGSSGVWVGDKGIICSDLNGLGVTNCKYAAYYDKSQAFALQARDSLTSQQEIVFSNYPKIIDVRGLNSADKWPLSYWMNQHNPVRVEKSKLTKKNMSHWMLQEIHDQIDCTNVTSISFNSPIFIGCGSSYYAGKFAEYHYRIHGKVALSEYASEFLSNNEFLNKYQPVFISQSGETKDIYEIMRKVKNPSLITNNINSKCAKIASNLYNIGAGQEKSVAATKTFFFTCLSLLDVHDRELGILSEYLQRKIKGWADQVQSFLEGADFDKCVFMGTGYTYPIAKEGALKMKEVAYIPSEGIPAAEIKHGPIALADEHTLCVVMSSHLERVQDNMEEIRSRGGIVLDVWREFLYDWPISNAALYGLAPIFPCQLLAFYTALKKGINPDYPKGLAKSVTV